MAKSSGGNNAGKKTPISSAKIGSKSSGSIGGKKATPMPPKSGAATANAGSRSPNSGLRDNTGKKMARNPAVPRDKKPRKPTSGGGEHSQRK